MYHCFYHNPVKGYDVPANAPRLLDMEAVVDWMHETIGDEPDSFFGIVDSQGRTLQFYLEDYGKRIRMEIPDPENRGSHARYLDFGEALKVVRTLQSPISLEHFPELEFNEW